MKVPIWGWAAPGEKIRVEFVDQLKTTEADAAGHWSVTLASMSAALAAASLTARSANVVTVNNVLVGEVWFLSGQSNMEYALFHCEGGDEAIAMKAEYATREEKARPLQEQYDQAVARSRAEGTPAPPVPTGLAGVFRGPSMVYNGEVAPLIPLAVRGMAWYQGEGNRT